MTTYIYVLAPRYHPRNAQGGVGFLCGRARPAVPALVRFIVEHPYRTDGGLINGDGMAGARREAGRLGGSGSTATWR